MAGCTFSTPVGSNADITRSLPGNSFVGREWELGQLRAGLSQAKAGQGQLYAVSGEVGIGKTRLAA
jgi:hypothetical protein